MGPVSVLAALLSAGAPPPETVLELKERVPLAFLFMSPAKEAGKVRSSALIAELAERIEAETDLAVRVTEPTAVSDCAGRLACFVRAVRPDYDRGRLLDEQGQPIAYAQYEKRLEAERVPVPAALLVLSSVPLGDEDRLIPQWIDTHRALSLDHEADRDDPSWEADVEARIRAYAVPLELPNGRVRDESEARAFLARLVTEALRPELEARGHWRPFGTVLLDDAPDGAAIRLEGRPVGTTRSGPVRLDGVRPGRRVLELVSAQGGSWRAEFELGPGGSVELSPRFDPDHGPLRDLTLVGGIGLALGGAALAAWAIAQPAPALTYCPGPCGDRFLLVGEDASGVAFGGSGGGALAGPLGASLLAAGATWSIGALLTSPEDNPWWPLLGGLVLGGAVYGVLAAVDGAP